MVEMQEQFLPSLSKHSEHLEPFDRLTENRSCVSSVSTIHGGRRANGNGKSPEWFLSYYLPSPNPFALSLSKRSSFTFDSGADACAL
jgi:hypothetical protein